jgi:hypothetical protein
LQVLAQLGTKDTPESENLLDDPGIARCRFGHGGQAETLEEWFDPARLQSDYVPKGFHLGPGPI